MAISWSAYLVGWQANSHKEAKEMQISFTVLWLWVSRRENIIAGKRVEKPGLHSAVKSTLLNWVLIFINVSTLPKKLSLLFNDLGFKPPQLGCQSELGMKNGTIPDSAITATTSLNQYFGPQLARLDTVKEGCYDGAWIPKYQDIGQWIQVSGSWQNNKDYSSCHSGSSRSRTLRQKLVPYIQRRSRSISSLQR